MNRALSLLPAVALAAGLIFLYEHVKGVRVKPQQTVLSGEQRPAKSAIGSSAQTGDAPLAKGGAATRTQTSAVRASSWATGFRTSDDYFDFISGAAEAAYAGDGRAAFYVGKALLACMLVTKQYHNVPDPQARFATEMVALQKAPQWVRDQRNDEYRRCIHLAEADPFIHLPARPEGYSFRYWLDQAVADGDPVAQATRASDEVSQIGAQPSPAARSVVIDRAQGRIESAVSSKDPDAIFRIGMLLSNASYATDTLKGAALALAACDLGYDCSAKNTENPFAVCRFSGACPADGDFSYYLQQSLGAERYSEAYAKAQEFKDALARDDMEAVRSFTQIKSH